MSVLAMTAQEPRKSKVVADIFGLTRNEMDAIEVLGFQLFEQGRGMEAQAIFQGLIALDHRMYQGYAGMGALAMVEQKLDEASRWLTEAVQRNPNDPTVQANLGETLLRLGQFDAAGAAFHKALELDPQQKDPGVNRARTILAGMQHMVRDMHAAGLSRE